MGPCLHIRPSSPPIPTILSAPTPQPAPIIHINLLIDQHIPFVSFATRGSIAVTVCPTIDFLFVFYMGGTHSLQRPRMDGELRRGNDAKATFPLHTCGT
jgi:hypothetical protein